MDTDQIKYQQGHKLCYDLVNELEDGFILFHEDHEVQHLKNVYKQLTNIKGNVNTLMRDEKNYAHRANKEQLRDGLFKLHSICKYNDEWIERVREIVKLLFDWKGINASLARMDENARKTGQAPAYEGYRNQYCRFLEFHQYTEDELIELVTQLPYISKIYTGKHDVIVSIGAMLV